MKKLVSAFVKFPFYGRMVIFILLVIGGLAALNMKKATFPLTESHVVSVTVAYQGATPKEMEEGVTTLIEDAIRGIPGIKEFSSKSQENVSMVTITAENSYDIDEFLNEIKTQVDGISNFPSSAERPIVSKQRKTDMVMFVSIAREDGDLLKLNEEANRIEDDLLASGIMSQINIFGLPSKLEISVELDAEQLKRYDITFSDIKNAIAANNIDLHGGKIKNDREEIKVLTRNRTSDIEFIKNIVVKSGIDGNHIQVKDLASVVLQFEDSPNASYIHGDRNVTMMITKLSSEDLEEITEFTEDYIKLYNTEHVDTEMTVMHGFLEIINSQLNILLSNGLMGMILVIISLSLLLNFRLSLWVSWGIPASLLGMFIVAFMMGLTINMITLFGMILIIGILVDDGVVIGENIFTHYEMGKSPRRAAIDGTMEVLPAVITSIGTTIIAFLPLMFIEGMLEMMYEMAFVVIIALVFSLLEGIFVLPGHLASERVLKPVNKKSVYGKVRTAMDKVILGFRDKAYIPFLRILMRNKLATFIGITAIVILTGGLLASGTIRTTFFPQVSEKNFVIDLALKPGTNDEITKQIIFDIEKTVWETNQELADEYGEETIIANTQVNIGSSFNGTESGTNAANIRVFMEGNEDSRVTDVMLKVAIKNNVEEIPEAYKFTVGASNHFGAPVSISLQGYDMEDLEAAANELKDELNKMESLYNIMDNSQLGNQEVRITLKPEAYALGLNTSTVMQEVRNAYYGALAQRMQEGKDEIWIYVRYPESNRKNIGQLEDLIIHTQKGDYPLGRIANFTIDRSLNTINRINGKREIRVEAYQKDKQESAIDLNSFIESEILPDILEKHPEVNFQHQGQQKDTGDQMNSIITYFGIAFMLIVIIIMLYFRSFKQGIMILIMIPLGIIGALWGHGIHGEPVSMMSLWGLIALSGTIINDAIVFLSKYNTNLKEGMKVNEAAVEAGRSRFRAIFLTTVTTTIGLMPLILESSREAQMLIPMAIAVAYGILFGTGFILLSLPVVVSAFSEINVKFNQWFGKEKRTAEELEVAVKVAKIEQLTAAAYLEEQN